MQYRMNMLTNNNDDDSPDNSGLLEAGLKSQFLSQVQRYAEAANQYLEAFKLAPTEYDFAVAAATAFRQAGHNQKAEQLYKEALSLRPMESGAYINLGAMLHLNGKFDEAAKYYQTALKLNPNDHIAMLNLSKLRTFTKKSKVKT